MSVIGVIPARWASTRFPGKSLTPLCGKPLIQWVAERCRQARRLDDVLVATDDDRIRQVVSALGIRTVMTRGDHPSGTDRVAEAVRGLNADVVANIQGDEPLIDPALIDRLVDVMLAERRWDMATAAAPLDADVATSSVCKVVFDRDDQALYFSRCPIPFIREPGFRADQPAHWRHIGIYLYRAVFLEKLVAEPPCLLERAECLEQLRALYLGGRIKVIRTDHAGIGVDTPADVSQVEAMMKQKGIV
ncbi:MAG: 3-deoxy-manno-octulosonate cytidylyltransferase [Verrucomicrobia bacterium]|nr:3-deoxy-manno-octulosonate cytidylyltransferase [Verrucomicrobiota bacterium]MBU4289652.1 3-deoxy-manno-octulosonate cytidylyltransferase [Verrucomicrobiota bacterium]MBU4430094.1 3-deoxy-manno-octulosonate cytidylyltransferase [Verrucomicrobiota bacterium]MCG2681350.1 3-deoxy-manno-octulosonate cytidylyltransferase [Kiritimatiellia bacterium]